MSYTAIAVAAVVLAIIADIWLLRTRLIMRVDFWLAYAIMFVFQLLTNGVLTGREVVRYADDAIVGVGNDKASPEFVGGGRIFFAPIEDLMFGFALILWVLGVWVWLGRKGLQRTPVSGPPRWRKDVGQAE